MATTSAQFDADGARLFDGIATALNQHDLDAALRDVLAVVVEGLGLVSGWIWLLEPSSDRFYLAAAHRLPPALAQPVEMTGDPCWCMESFRDGDFVSRNLDVISCSRLRRALRAGRGADTLGLQAHASIALRFGRTSLGLLNVCPPPGSDLSSAALTTLAAAGAQIGLAVERARLAGRAIEAARTDERARLARDLHDTVTQDLVAIALQLEAALHESPSPRARTALESALGLARRSIEGTRGSLLALRSPILGSGGLAAALAALAHDFTSETGVPVQARIDPSAALAPEAEEELYRIASEALTNVRKHARAREVRLELTVPFGEPCATAAQGPLALTVRDDGVGFDPDRPAGAGFGLETMRERAHAAGGDLSVTSAPGAGTTIAVRIGSGGR